MDTLTQYLQAVNGVAWGPAMLFLLAGTGLFLTLGLKLTTILRVPAAFGLLWRGRKSDGEGDVSPFNALMTAMSATVGTGNIAGVSTAIFLGGPGAIFWMWVIALFGMATKYAEAVLAVKYRELDSKGEHVGGPMYYIRNGLGKKWAWMGTLFAAFAAIASFGMGNTVQGNSIAHALETTFAIPTWATGLVLMVLVGGILLGGIQRIAQVAGKLVPFMGIVYVAAGLVIILMNLGDVPAAIGTILHYAFNPIAATGGFAGAGVMAAIRFGAARGVFSNEAGLGSAPIAHAAAKTDDPVQQGTIAMLGTFLDTLVICTITALIVVMSGVWTSGVTGAALTADAFAHYLSGGEYIVTLGLALFAFTTILGWSFYGERAAQFLFGEGAVKVFRVAWVLVVPLGAVASLDFVWLLADTMNALMALPNLTALLLLSPVVFRLTKEAMNKKKAEPAGETV